MKWIPIGIPASPDIEQMLKDDVHSLCAIYGYPSELLSNEIRGQVTEDAEFEVINPKELPSIQNTKDL